MQHIEPQNEARPLQIVSGHLSRMEQIAVCYTPKSAATWIILAAPSQGIVWCWKSNIAIQFSELLAGSGAGRELHELERYPGAPVSAPGPAECERSERGQPQSPSEGFPCCHSQPRPLSFPSSETPLLPRCTTIHLCLCARPKLFYCLCRHSFYFSQKHIHNYSMAYSSFRQAICLHLSMYFEFCYGC